VNHWWRAYNEAVNDPKLQLLSDSLFRAWFNVMCIASANGGELPPLKDVAFTLRIAPAKAAQVLAQLHVAGLLDKTETGFAPHNWKGRQYISDSSAERVKRHREKRAAAGLQSQWTPPKALRQAVYERDGFKCVYCGSGDRLSLDHRTPEIRGGTHHIDNLATACLSCNGAKRDMTEAEYRVSVTLLKRPQTTEQNTEQIDVADDARARPNQSFDLAERLLMIAGHDKSFWPPGWCGAPHRVATWLAQGWKPEIIVAAVTAAAARKRGPPANSVQFFENAIAEEHARQAAPLPQVEIREAPTITVTNHGKPKSAVIQAIDDLNQRIADFDDRGGSDGLRGPEGEDAPRLLSHG
jgi:hypothetical protein